MKIKRVFLWAALLFLPVFLAACNTAESHLWLKSPGWSRAALVGRSGVSAPAAVYPLQQDAYVLFALADKPQAGWHLRLAHYQAGEGTLITQDYDWELAHRPSQMDLRPVEDGWRFFWLDDNHLWTGRVDVQGNWLETPHDLQPGLLLGNFVILPQQDDWLILAAGTRRSPGVYALDMQGGCDTLSDDGVYVRAMRDAEGNVHVLWAVYPPAYIGSALYYGLQPAAAAWTSFQAQKVYNLPISTSTHLDDLALGVDSAYVYIIWTTNTVAGLEAGTVVTQYLSAPLGEMPRAAAQEIYVPVTYDLPFSASAPTDLLTGARIDLRAAPFAPSTALQDLAILPLPSSEMAMAFRSNMLHLWRKQRVQINVLYWKDGAPAYFQPLTFTSTYSLKPALMRGADGALYITWLEKIVSNNYSVYFASTHPQVVDDMHALTWAERGNLAFQTLFGMLIGALLAPLAASVWFLAPIFIFLLLGALRRWIPKGLNPYWDYVVLSLSLLAFWAAKRATLPGMFSYVPFSAWIPNISAPLGQVLRYAVPIGIAALSLWVAWHYTYRRKNKAPLYFMLLYIGVDALLSTAIYAVLIYGVF